MAFIETEWPKISKCRCGAQAEWEFDKSIYKNYIRCPSCWATAHTAEEWNSQMIPVIELKARVAELEHEVARLLRALRMDG